MEILLPIKPFFATYGNFVKVNGTANLKNSNFGLMKRSYTDLEANNVVIVVGGKIKCRKRKIKCRIFATNYLSFNLKLKL